MKNLTFTIIILSLFFVSCSKNKEFYRVDVDKLVLREKPSKDSNVLILLDKGYPLKFIEKTNVHETINSSFGYWIKVSTLEQKIGYVFGGLCKNVSVVEKWNIGSNDGNGESEIFFYDDGFFTFVGWNQVASGSWIYNEKSQELTFNFINSDYFTKLISRISTRSLDYKKEWNIEKLDAEKSSVTFKVTNANRSSSREGKRIDFFGYYAYYFFEK